MAEEGIECKSGDGAGTGTDTPGAGYVYGRLGAGR